MRLALIGLLSLCCRSTVSFERERLVVWNVGQGSWASLISTTTCDHFDVGGEKRYGLASSAASELSSLCSRKLNRVYLSHLDFDHVSNLNRISRKWRAVCLTQKTRDWNLKKQKSFMLQSDSCKPNRRIREVHFSINSKQSNDLSRIFVLDQNWLFPGDSTTSAERLWANEKISKIRVLILGHHGSRTSTSEFLLSRLPKLKMTVASARYRKYGHPHAEVRERLSRHKLPMLITEEWGDLIFEL